MTRMPGLDYSSDSESEERKQLDQGPHAKKLKLEATEINDTDSPKSTKSLQSPEQQKPKKCVFCDNPPKYTCPACSKRTCSIACCNRHKDTFAYTGKRNVTA